MKQSYVGYQTNLARKNFPFSVGPVNTEFLRSIALIKRAAALAHASVGELDRTRARVIVVASDEILDGKLASEFPLPWFQGGAGTSIHMNVNEVIAGRATELLRRSGKKLTVHPNDHVNMSHSTNDVNPSAIKIAAYQLCIKLSKDLDSVIAVFTKNGARYHNVLKLGRTHLQDAVPICVGAEFDSWAEALLRDKKRLQGAQSYFLELSLGGTAVGNSVNASPAYIKALYKELSKATGIGFRPAANLMSQTSGQTDFCMLSQALVTLTLDASRIATDIRLLGSGPNGGIGEFTLSELQPGSSIMPGKVNPVLPEAVNELYYFVSGNNLTIEHAVHGAQLELGVMIPVIAQSLLSSITLTDEVLTEFAYRCIATLTVNRDRCRYLLEHSTAYATLLTPVLGYDAVSKIVKEAVGKHASVRDLVIQRKLLSAAEFDRIIARASKTV